MKKVIVLLALSGLFSTTCKNKSNPLKEEAWCVYKVSSNGTKTLYRCCPNSNEAGSAGVEIRNAGGQSTSVKKSKCSEC